MANEPIIIKLTPEDVLRLTRILLDEDKEEALLFLKQCLKPQLDQATRGRLDSFFRRSIITHEERRTDEKGKYPVFDLTYSHDLDSYLSTHFLRAFRRPAVSKRDCPKPSSKTPGLWSGDVYSLQDDGAHS